MRLVEYQQVEHALPDGTPDPKAADNHYYRSETTWYVASDSDAVAPDASGTRHMHYPEFKYDSFLKYGQKGRAGYDLALRFTHIIPRPDAARKPLKTGSGTIGAIDYDVHGGNRAQYLLTRTVVEETETHSQGRRRATRTTREAQWGTMFRGGLPSGPYMAPAESTFFAQSEPHIRAEPVAYGYRPFTLPRDDEF